MKKFFIVSLACAALSACGSNSNNNNSPANVPTADQVRSSADVVCTRQANASAIASVFNQNYNGDAADALSTAFKTCGRQTSCLDKSAGDMVRLSFAYETDSEKDHTKSDALLAAYDKCSDTDSYCLAKGYGDMLRYQLNSQSDDKATALKAEYDACGDQSSCLDKSVADMEMYTLNNAGKTGRSDELLAAYAKCGK